MNPRLLMLLAAGTFSLFVYLAGRDRRGLLTRESNLRSLQSEIGNWLPRLPFMEFVRLQVEGSTDYLDLTADRSRVRVQFPQRSLAQRRRGEVFREICTALGHDVREAALGDALDCELGNEPERVTRLVRALLRGLFDADAATRIIAATPR
jgi:hypothetical protein